MDRERAKIELMQIYGSLSSEKQMAIDTLLSASENPNKSEIPTSCEDAISREDINSIAKEVYLEVANMKFDDDLKYKGDIIGYVSATFRRILCEKVSKLSSVTPSKRPKGHWIKDRTETYKLDNNEIAEYNIFKCSECGREEWLTVSYDPIYKYPFCHCGADMRGAE